MKPVYTVKIRDGFCEYTYKFSSGGNQSMSDIVEAIESGTDLRKLHSYLNKSRVGDKWLKVEKEVS
jgi:hypothetical protein